MFGKLAFGATLVAASIIPAAALAASQGFNLSAVVPVQCSVNQQSIGAQQVTGSAISLGTFREYCNAPGGYQLVVRYAPGSLKGARISAGSDAVVLDGSGVSVLSRSTGPRVRERALSMTVGPNGFDTDRLEVDVVVN